MLPAKTKEILVDNKAINDGAIISVPSDTRGLELPMACVVRCAKSRSASGSVEEKAAKTVRWLETKVTLHKNLRDGGRFVDQFLSLRTRGKILHRILNPQFKNEAPKAKA